MVYGRETGESQSEIKKMSDVTPKEVVSRIGGYINEVANDIRVADADGVVLRFPDSFTHFIWTRFSDPEKRNVLLTDGKNLHDIGRMGVLLGEGSLTVVDPVKPEDPEYTGIRMVRTNSGVIEVFQVAKQDAPESIVQTAEISGIRTK